MINDMAKDDDNIDTDEMIRILANKKVEMLEWKRNAEDEIDKLNTKQELLKQFKQFSSFKDSPSVKRIYIDRNAALSIINMNLDKIEKLNSFANLGKSRIERSEVDLPYYDDHLARGINGVALGGIGVLLFSMLRKGNIFEIISAFVVAFYLENKLEQSKEYISVSRALSRCESKVNSAMERYHISDDIVNQYESFVNAFNNIYDYDDISDSIDKWNEIIDEIDDIISEIDDDISILLQQKMSEENVLDSDTNGLGTQKVIKIIPFNNIT